MKCVADQSVLIDYAKATVLLKSLSMDYAIDGAKEGVKAFLKAFKPAAILLFAFIVVYDWLWKA